MSVIPRWGSRCTAVYTVREDVVTSARLVGNLCGVAPPEGTRVEFSEDPPISGREVVELTADLEGGALGDVLAAFGSPDEHSLEDGALRVEYLLAGYTAEVKSPLPADSAGRRAVESRGHKLDSSRTLECRAAFVIDGGRVTEAAARGELCEE